MLFAWFGVAFGMDVQHLFGSFLYGQNFALAFPGNQFRVILRIKEQHARHNLKSGNIELVLFLKPLTVHGDSL